MYVGRGIEVHYAFKTEDGHIKGAWLINSKNDIDQFRELLETIEPQNFILSRVEHKDIGEEYKIHSRDELISETYKWLLKKPSEKR